jgi:hypothetical protein
MTARKGQLGQASKEMTAGTGQPGQNKQDRLGTGLLGQYRMVRI